MGICGLELIGDGQQYICAGTWRGAGDAMLQLRGKALTFKTM
jgi:hypothetical protein